MKFLFLGAHTDDIEIGAGGLLSSVLRNPNHQIKYLTFSRCLDIPRNKDIEMDQESVISHLSHFKVNVSMLNYENRYLSKFADRIREDLENERDGFKPDIIITHWVNDIHQDHKVVAEETIRVFRNSSIIAYECIRSCPKFAPNYYYALTESELCDKNNLIGFYQTQSQVYYVKPEVITAFALTRGAEAGLKYAEGFEVVRLIGGVDKCVQLL